MNKWVWLSVVSYLIGGCTRQSAQIQNKNNTVQVAKIEAQDTINKILVDSTFTNIDSTNIDVKCERYGRVQARADGRVGYVEFHKEISMYSITSSPFAGLTDELWTGYVCNLPDSYKKAGIKVGFVGRYYTAYHHIKPRHATDTPLYLVVEKIKVLQ